MHIKGKKFTLFVNYTMQSTGKTDWSAKIVDKLQVKL